jgi:hypothetical protein
MFENVTSSRALNSEPARDWSAVDAVGATRIRRRRPAAHAATRPDEMRNSRR